MQHVCKQAVSLFTSPKLHPMQHNFISIPVTLIHKQGHTYQLAHIHTISETATAHTIAAFSAVQLRHIMQHDAATRCVFMQQLIVLQLCSQQQQK